VSVTIPALRKRLELKLFDWPAAPSDTRAEEEALDFDRLRPPLVLRNWRPGDAYRPAGRKQPRKLKELFIRRRIPAGQRPAWPVLTSAGQVVWSLGMPVAHEFAARRYTRAGLKIVEETAGQLDQETL
jgi:tRNA(Ile)-lysidine synthetase-like protein